jgi:DHA2 family multidrug resistance protein
MFIRGLGITMIFMPTNLSALGPLPKKDVAQASGLFNLSRQMGGSIGIAALTAILERRIAFHRVNVVSHMTAVDPKVTERLGQYAHGFVSHGTDAVTAQHKALASLEGMAQMQSAILGYADTFVMVAGVFLIMMPMVLLFRKVDPNAKVSMGH